MANPAAIDRQELIRLARKGYSRRMAAEACGISKTTLCRRTRKLDIPWPTENKSLARQLAYRTTIPAKMRESWRSKATLVEFDGSLVSLREAAERAGVNYKTLCRRYQRGVRGKALFRQPQTRAGRHKRNYRLGITVAEAEIIIAYARDRSVRAASRKFDIPLGAVNALLNGDWHRID